MLSLERGGGESFDLEMARHLYRMGHSISFLSGIPVFGREPIANPTAGVGKDVSHYRLRSPYFGWFPWDRTKGGWRLRVLDFVLFEWLAARWVLRMGSRFDVIQVCELPYFTKEVKKKGLEVPVVMRLTAPNFYDPWGGIAAADAVIASGETVACVRKTIRSDCHDVPNAVDTEMFRPHASSFRVEHGVPSEAFVVLYVARFQDFKNHALLVRAFAMLLAEVKHAWLVLVGKGPLKRRTERQVHELGISSRVLFLGEQPFERLPDIYAAADVLAISSDFESFCFAALEAMATGLPIVTTDCGWVPRLLGPKLATDRIEKTCANGCLWHEGGIVVPLRNAEALAVAMRELSLRPDLGKQMGMRNRRAAITSFSWHNSAKALTDVYLRVLEK